MPRVTFIAATPNPQVLTQCPYGSEGDNEISMVPHSPLYDTIQPVLLHTIGCNV